ncbi:NmrA/HSCARG family protein (plasmid) [Polymorphobacter sp. PAMC 29334]|uniref:NmrA/HSCARG family protein n=1 Tax=Polymorphobacter sp. PAMC 29334 TaxID=2862331 RepID=UPI001C686F0A|nr:NmrA/HSCARG family protein [Polymorphobacter sp. PAMC 29334]QYE33015.1 NmrA/HSCARG family protein [Polymorphobacter sp. PAMC 29334]
MSQSFLVIGATGNQGGAVINALLRDGGDWNLKALVRNPSSKRAQALGRRGVELVRADLDDAGSVNQALAGVYGVYSVQSPEAGGPEREEKQGIMVADAAKAAGVAHFVYSSVAGADRRSGVPHFESKWQVEQHIAAIGLPATIIRPTLFMDNFATFKFRLVMLAMLRSFVPENQRTQMVAVRDIGMLTAKAFAEPKRFVGRAIELAGDAVTRGELVRLLRHHGIKPAPSMNIPGWMRGQVPEEYQLMMNWIAGKGFEADISQLNAEFPFLTSVDRWAQNPEF